MLLRCSLTRCVSIWPMYAWSGTRHAFPVENHTQKPDWLAYYHPSDEGTGGVKNWTIACVCTAGKARHESVLTHMSLSCDQLPEADSRLELADVYSLKVVITLRLLTQNS